MAAAAAAAVAAVAAARALSCEPSLQKVTDLKQCKQSQSLPVLCFGLVVRLKIEGKKKTKKYFSVCHQLEAK